MRVTKSEAQTILHTVADEFEALDQADLARAYRRAAHLVDTIEESPTRRRRRTARAATRTAAPSTGRRPRQRTATAASTDS
jgi:hypothetical protein